MALLDGYFDPDALGQTINSPAFYAGAGLLAGMAPTLGYARLPQSGAQTFAAGMSGLLGGLGQYQQAQLAQQQVRKLQNENQLSDMTVKGYRDLQAARGGAPPSAGLLGGFSGSSTPPSGGLLGGMTPQPTGGLLGGIAADPNAAAGAPNSAFTADPNAPGAELRPTVAPGRFAAIDETTLPREGLSLQGSVNNPVPPTSQRAAMAGVPQPQSQPQPLFDVGSLRQQYAIASSTPGMQPIAQQILAELNRGVPENAYLAQDGSIQMRPGGAQYYATKAMGEKGILPGPNGVFAAAPGVPEAQAAITGAQEWSKVAPEIAKAGGQAWATLAPEIAKANAAPFTLEHPGAVRVVNGRVVAMNPIEMQTVDPVTGAGYRQFVMPPVSVSGGGGGMPPVAGRGGAGAPPVSIAGSGLQPGGAALPTGRTVGQAVTPQDGGGAPAGAVGPRYQTSLSPMQVSAQQRRGTELEDYGKTLQDDAQAAQQNNFLLDQMRSESQSWRQGKFADFEGNARSYLQAFARQLSIATPGLDKQIADWESFSKNAGELVRQATRQTSSKAAFQEMQLISKALPSAEMSGAGFSQIADQLQSLNDYRIAKQQAADAWRTRQGGDGTLSGFETSWNQNLGPAAFLVHRMTPDQWTATAANLSQTAEGRATIKRLMTQMQFAQSNGLFGN